MNSDTTPLSVKISNDLVLLDTEVFLKKGINILVGENGSGKTLFAYAIANKSKEKNSKIKFLPHWIVDSLILDDSNVKNMKYVSVFTLAHFNDFCSNVFISPQTLWDKFEDVCSNEGEKNYFLQIAKLQGESYARDKKNRTDYKNTYFSDVFTDYFKTNLFSILDDKSKQKIIQDVLNICHKKPNLELEEYLKIWINFYSKEYKKYLLGQGNLLPYLNYCLFYYSLKDFLKSAKKFILTKNLQRKKKLQKILNECLEEFDNKESNTAPIEEINKLFEKAGLTFFCKIEETQDEGTFTKKSFKLIFHSRVTKREKRLPDDLSTGEKSLISMFDCLSWFKLKKDSKNIVLFIDEFDAFLNPLQAKILIDKLNLIETKIYIILVSQRPITISQLNTDFNYLLAEKRTISNSNQDEILNKLLKDTPDLNVYKNKQLYIFIESKEKKIDKKLYEKITKNLFNDENAKINFIPIGSKSQVQTVFNHSNKDDFPNNLVGIVDNDGDKNLEKKHLFNYAPYYSVENVLLSPPILIQFLVHKTELKEFSCKNLEQIYIEEIAKKIWDSKNDLKDNQLYEKGNVIDCKFSTFDKDGEITSPIPIPEFLIKEQIKPYSIVSYLEWLEGKGCKFDYFNHFKSNNKLDEKEKEEKLNRLKNKLLMDIVNSNLKIVPIEIEEMFERIFKNHLPKND